MVMTREVLPHAFLRIVSQPKDDKLNIVEYKFISCQYDKAVHRILLMGNRMSSHSTGGSGGETRLTENITIGFEAVRLHFPFALRALQPA